MALIVNPMDSRLQIQLYLGIDDEGKEVTKTKSYSRIKSGANDEDVFEVAQALADLQDHPILAVRKISTTELEED